MLIWRDYVLWDIWGLNSPDSFTVLMNVYNYYLVLKSCGGGFLTNLQCCSGGKVLTNTRIKLTINNY